MNDFVEQRGLRVCFVGVGSIAKRHIRNLRAICMEKSFSLTIDALRREPSRGLVEGVDRVITSLDDIDVYDVIFITNPTSMHIETIKSLILKGKHFFIEKPLCVYEGLEELKTIQWKPDNVYYVACPLRYHPIIKYIKDSISPDEILSLRCISSSYLPEWREGVDYRNTYSSHSALGGGVAIDLIHEWDYITDIVGYPRKVFCLKKHLSGLEMDCEDYAGYIGEYEDKVVELHLDYFGRKEVRVCEIFTAAETISADLINKQILFSKAGKCMDFYYERDDYQKEEIINFLDMIFEGKENVNNIWRASRTLKLTYGIV